MILAFIQGIGPLELSIVLIILLLVLGPKRLPSLGRSLGGGMREFKKSVTSKHDDADADAVDHAVEKPVQMGASSAETRAVAVDGRPLEGEIVPERR